MNLFFGLKPFNRRRKPNHKPIGAKGIDARACETATNNMIRPVIFELSDQNPDRETRPFHGWHDKTCQKIIERRHSLDRNELELEIWVGMILWSVELTPYPSALRSCPHAFRHESSKSKLILTVCWKARLSQNGSFSLWSLWLSLTTRDF